MRFSLEYLCRDGRTWRELTTPTGAPVETESQADAIALAKEIWDRHRRPARVLNQTDRPVYSFPLASHAQ